MGTTLGELGGGITSRRRPSVPPTTTDGTISCKAVATLPAAQARFEPASLAIEDLTTFEGGKGRTTWRDRTFRDQRLVLPAAATRPSTDHFPGRLTWPRKTPRPPRHHHGAADWPKEGAEAARSRQGKARAQQQRVTHVHGNGRLNADHYG
jgi:hypothetical protein